MMLTRRPRKICFVAKTSKTRIKKTRLLDEDMAERVKIEQSKRPDYLELPITTELPTGALISATHVSASKAP
jgi:hypothetical protein